MSHQEGFARVIKRRETGIFFVRCVRVLQWGGAMLLVELSLVGPEMKSIHGEIQLEGFFY